VDDLADRLTAEHERRWKAFDLWLSRSLGQTGRYIKAEIRAMVEDSLSAHTRER
jgi:hypothetical protein